MLGKVEAKCRGASQDWGNAKETLKKEMEFANDPRNDVVTAVQGQIGEIQDIMMENMDKMLERGDKIEGMVQKSENIASEGAQFRKRGKELKTKMWCQDMKVKAMMCFVLLVCTPPSPSTYFRATAHTQLNSTSHAVHHLDRGPGTVQAELQRLLRSYTSLPRCFVLE